MSQEAITPPDDKPPGMQSPGMQSPGMQSIERMVAVIDFVAAHAANGCKLADVVAGTALGRATAHRFLKELERIGLLEFDEWSGRFFPGVKLVAWGASGANRFGLADRARPAMRRLAERTSDTIYLTLRVGDEAMCIAREEGAFPIKTLTLNVGDRRPLGVGAGPLAILMTLPEDEQRRVFDRATARFGQHGLDAASVHEMLEMSRRSGFGLNSGRMMPDMSGIGVPICTSDGPAIGAISVAAISKRMESPRRDNIVAWIREEVVQLEAELAPLLGPMVSEARRTTIARKGS
jgi:DNA-binding IclR family transcriptional regulator